MISVARIIGVFPVDGHGERVGRRQAAEGMQCVVPGIERVELVEGIVVLIVSVGVPELVYEALILADFVLVGSLYLECSVGIRRKTVLVVKTLRLVFLAIVA